MVHKRAIEEILIQIISSNFSIVHNSLVSLIFCVNLNFLWLGHSFLSYHDSLCLCRGVYHIDFLLILRLHLFYVLSNHLSLLLEFFKILILILHLCLDLDYDLYLYYFHMCPVDLWWAIRAICILREPEVTPCSIIFSSHRLSCLWSPSTNVPRSYQQFTE